MVLESKRKLMVRHNMARLLANDGGLGAGITEERLRSIHTELSAGLGPHAYVDSGAFRPGGRGVKGVAEAVSAAMSLIEPGNDSSATSIPKGAAAAGAHIIKSMAEIAPFKTLNVEVAAVVAAKVLEQVGVKVGFHRVLSDDLADTAKMATKGNETRLQKIIENHSRPIEQKDESKISFGKIGSKLPGIESSIERAPSLAGPGM